MQGTHFRQRFLYGAEPVFDFFLIHTKTPVLTNTTLNLSRINHKFLSIFYITGKAEIQEMFQKYHILINRGCEIMHTRYFTVPVTPVAGRTEGSKPYRVCRSEKNVFRSPPMVELIKIESEIHANYP